MAPNSLLNVSNFSNFLSRRSFLAGLAAGVLALVTRPAAAKPQYPWGDEHPLDRYHRLKAIGEALDPARAALIDQWTERLDDLTGQIWDLEDTLGEARYTDPAAIDGHKLLDQMDALRRTLELVCDGLATSEASDLIEAVSGRYEFALVIEKEISEPDEAAMEPDRLLDEIGAIEEHHPADGAYLRGLWEAKFGQVSS